MRQAGRYLPEYRRLREKHSLKTLFLTPELAFEVTKMPINRFGVDAAILFSDITVIALSLGFDLDFQEGPKITPPLTPSHVDHLPFFPEKLEPIFQTIRLLKQDLLVPLLGFCGAPFTVASYLIGDLERTTDWMRRDPLTFQNLIDKITHATIAYLQLQKQAGVDAVQIFDSWANVLTKEEHERYSLFPLQRCVASINLPSLFFMREMGPYVEKIPCGLSLDWTISLREGRQRTAQPIQGNLDPDFLFQPLDQIRTKTKELLYAMEGDPGFILNLGHGVKPQTPVDAVRCFVDTALYRK